MGFLCLLGVSMGGEWLHRKIEYLVDASYGIGGKGM
jgi:hypothetical protein